MTITQRYLSMLAPTLSDRDFAIIADVGKFKLVSGVQLRRLHFQSMDVLNQPRSQQMVLKRLVERQVLTRIKTRGVGGPRGGSQSYIYTLGPAGIRLSQVTSEAPRRAYTEYEPSIFHYLAITELYVRLVEAARLGDIEKLESFDTEPYCWRDFGDGQTLKPDAVLKLHVKVSGKTRRGTFFIEVDRGTQYGTKIATKLPTYLAYKAQRYDRGIFPLVVFLAPTSFRVGYLTRLVHTSTEPHVFRVGLIDDFVDVLLAAE